MHVDYFGVAWHHLGSSQSCQSVVQYRYCSDSDEVIVQWIYRFGKPYLRKMKFKEFRRLAKRFGVVFEKENK